MPDGFQEQGRPTEAVEHPGGIIPTSYLVHSKYDFFSWPSATASHTEITSSVTHATPGYDSMGALAAARNT
jgi:hypothetical protein